MEYQKQQQQESPSLQVRDDMWNPRIVLHTTKSTDPISEEGLEAKPFLTEESVHKFIELSSRVVMTTATAWWTLCELLDYIKLRSAEAKLAKGKYTGFESHTTTNEVPSDESEL